MIACQFCAGQLDCSACEDLEGPVSNQCQRLDHAIYHAMK